jgi:hypothetical protein
LEISFQTLLMKNGRSSREARTCRFIRAAHLRKRAATFAHQRWTWLASHCSLGWNHYGTSYATGKKFPFKDADPRQFIFGCVERTFEKDGQQIGIKGHNGHPYIGEPRLTIADTKQLLFRGQC